jgi:uncharacterized protein (TIGR04255 family)
VTYDKAPITEAVIDLVFEFDTPPTIEALGTLADELNPPFGHRQPINQVAMAVAMPESGLVADATQSTSFQQLGLRLSNSDLTRITQLRVNGANFSHMHPYTRWETFSVEAIAVFDGYIKRFAPRAVSRLALRYINQIEVPQDSDLDDYLNVTPRLLQDLPQQVTGYFMQLQLPQEDLGSNWHAIVNTGIGPAVNPANMNLLLDIDVYVQESLPATLESIAAVLAKLRDRKNKIFEAAITPKTREMIR